MEVFYAVHKETTIRVLGKLCPQQKKIWWQIEPKKIFWRQIGPRRIWPRQIWPWKKIWRRIGPLENICAVNLAPGLVYNNIGDRFADRKILVPNLPGANLLGPDLLGPDLPGPDLPGIDFWCPICRASKKCSAQFAAKSARGPFCLEPAMSHWEGLGVQCVKWVCSGSDAWSWASLASDCRGRPLGESAEEQIIFTPGRGRPLISDYERVLWWDPTFTPFNKGFFKHLPEAKLIIEDLVWPSRYGCISEMK